MSGKKIHQDLVIGILLLAVCGWVYYLIGGITVVKSAVFPRVVVTVITFLSLFVLWSGAVKTKAMNEAHTVTWKTVAFPISVCAIMGAYVLGINILGFIIASLAMLSGLLYYFKVRNWLLLTLYPIVITGIIYVVFIIVLRVRLPLWPWS